MLADVMTKPLPETRFVKLVSETVYCPQRGWVGVLDYNRAGGYAHVATHGVHRRITCPRPIILPAAHHLPAHYLSVDGFGMRLS